MAVTRKLLKGMGLTEEQQDTIIEEHTNTVNALKDELDNYKAEAEKAGDLQKQLDELNSKADGSEDWQKKYNDLQSEFNTYKDEQTQKETHSAKEKAYRELLKEAGVTDKHIDAIMKVSDVDGIELDKDGNITKADDLKTNIQDEWSDFITTTEVKGADTPNPPANTGGETMTRDDIMKIKDPVKRQDAIAKNLSLFEGKDD